MRNIVMKNERTYSFLRYLVVVVIFLFMSFWNYITPLWNDDEGWTRMSFVAIVKSCAEDYMNSNGRFLGQFLAKLMVNIPLPLEAVLNATAFTIMTLLIFRIVSLSNVYGINNEFTKLLLYIFVLLNILLLTPGFSQVYLWRPGAGNYLWLIVVDLIFINLIINKNNSFIYLTITTIIGFLSGGANENTGGGVLIVVLCITIINEKRIKNIIPIIGFIVGYAILMLSPGDHLRARLTNPEFMKLSFWGKIMTNLPQINNFVVHNLVYEVILFFILFGFGIFSGKKKLLLESLVWFIAGILVWYVLVLSPGSPDEPQTYFGGFILVVVANAKLFVISAKNDVIINQICTITLLVLAFFTFVNVSNGFIDAWRTDKAIARRNEEIISKKKKGINNIKVVPLDYYGKSKYAMFFWQFDISNDPNSWPNKSVAHHHKIKSIVLEN